MPHRVFRLRSNHHQIDRFLGFIRKHSLQSASMVQNSVRYLLEKQILTYRQDKGVKIYSVADRFLRLWLVKMY